MPEFSPTASQLLAITARDSTVLVAAGAGSGKTKVLTERLMSRLLDEENGADIDSFLIITFTRAAAGELRGRIMREISAALAADPGNRRLRRQSALCRRAQIGTIHSFCTALLREFSHLAEISPDFKVADEDRAAAMKAAALDRILERYYAEQEKHPGFLALADTVGAGRDDRRLADLVLVLHSRMQCHAWPRDWAARQIELLRAPVSDAGETPWGKEVLRSLQRSASYWSAEMDRCLALMRGESRVFAAYAESFGTTADALREFTAALEAGWDRARACLPIPFPKLKPLSASLAPEITEHVKKRRKACQDSAKKFLETFSLDSQRLLSDMALTAPAMSALLDLALDFDYLYTQDKRRAGLVDYSDLEHMTAKLLIDRDFRPTELSGQIAARYTEILVDEYQDVSQIQDAIFRAVSRKGRNLFLVGDVKQSIYRFRLADPTLFTRKYESFADADAAVPGEPRRILLQENFRSRREILNAANAVFSLCMSRELGDIDYDGNAALKYGASYTGEVPVPELVLLRAPEGDESEQRPDKTLLEAQYVAREIRRLVESGTEIEEKGQRRALRYGDVAILLRSVKGNESVFRRALAQEGIPTAGGLSGGFFSSVEVSTLLSLLAVLDNPHQDIPLIAVLRSPAFGFSADDLSRVRAAAKEGDFYEALCAAAKTDSSCGAFLKKLAALRSLTPDLCASELVWLLLEELDLLALCSAMSEGAQRRARLLEMLGLAERFERSGYHGLHRFVLWLRRLAAGTQEPSVGAGGSSAVQILSIHKSKGLEFPVVFLCDTARGFNLKSSLETVLIHPELGLGPKLTDLERRVEYPTLARRAIQLALNRETLSEELRLLYVAMTRPKERLYITALLSDPEARVEKLRDALCVPMSPEALARVPAPVDWLICAALADGGGQLRMSVRDTTENAPAEADRPVPTTPDAAISRELAARLSFVYPHAAAERLPSKVTATSLKGRFEPDGEAAFLLKAPRRSFRMPDFTRGEKAVTGAERGTATHLVLQSIDFARTDSPEQVRAEIERLRSRRFLSEREAAAVDAEAIVRLFASPLGRRIKSAPLLRREFRFSLLCPAETLYGEGAGEELLLQGVVDCCLEDADGITVIDYKTDRLHGRAACEERAAAYRPQLAAYTAALERICGKPVRECLLYFLSAGESVSLGVPSLDAPGRKTSGAAL